VTREIEHLPGPPGYLSGHLAADSPMYIASFNELADALHDYGVKVAVQLTAGRGRNAPKEYLKAIGAVAPSPLPCFSDPQIIARELTTVEMERLVESFGLAAETVSSAGIDAVELHAHNGHLLDQFQTALWNKRTDKYGGNLDGRLRLVREIIRAIKLAAGQDFPVIYRFSPTHYLRGGREIEEGLEIARRLEAAGVDAFHIDAGCFEVRYWASPPTTQRPGCMVDMAQKVKEAVTVPVIAVGKLGYPDLAEKVLKEGKADFIALGRPLLADPEWPNKVKKGMVEDLRPCIGCYEGCMGRIPYKHSSCAVNPATGMERKFALKPAEKKKTVLVVGGGPAGMEAARVAALRGHRVTLWERGNGLGGNLITASVPSFKKDYENLLKYFLTQLRKLGVTIESKKEATPESIEGIAPDVLFLATGSEPIIPEIPGVEGGVKKGTVVTAAQILLGRRQTGNRVLVVGGGLVGCETALYLAQKGKKITIVEVLESVAQDMFNASRTHLLKLLADANANILTETRILEITDEGMAIADKNGNRRLLEADTVVLAAGMKRSEEFFEALKDKIPEVFVIGDCAEPRNVLYAIWEGFRTARLI